MRICAAVIVSKTQYCNDGIDIYLCKFVVLNLFLCNQLQSRYICTRMPFATCDKVAPNQLFKKLGLFKSNIGYIHNTNTVSDAIMIPIKEHLPKKEKFSVCVFLPYANRYYSLNVLRFGMYWKWSDSSYGSVTKTLPFANALVV